MNPFKRIKCEECGNNFSSQEKLMQHQQVVHGKDRLYDCKSCNQNFTNMEDMRKHLQRYHSYKN